MVATRVEDLCEQLRALTSVRAVFVVDAYRRCIARAGEFDENETRLLLSLAHERPEEWVSDNEDWWCSLFAPPAGNAHVVTQMFDEGLLVIVFDQAPMVGVIRVRALAAAIELDRLMVPRGGASGGNASGAAAVVSASAPRRRG